MPSFSDYTNITTYFAKIRTNLSQNQFPKLSIITVVKDDQRGLIKTIDSVKSQNCLHVEHIIINAGNKLDKMDGVLILNEQDSGISDAFNKGLSGAAGELTLILNAGDVLLPNILNEIVEFMLARSTFGIFCFSAIFADENQGTFIRKSKDSDLSKFMSVVHPATFVRKSVYEKIGLFDQKFKIAMDYELLLRAKANNVSFLSTEKQIVIFDINGLSEKKWVRGFLETIFAKRLNKAKINFLYEFCSFVYQAAYMLLRSLKLYSVIYFCRKNFSTLSLYNE